MNQDSISLDRLQDIVEPSAVPWWPPAMGWWILLALLVAALVCWAIKLCQVLKANAYRSRALREIESAVTFAEMNAILKRTALAVYPRETVARLSGANWFDWLARTASLEIRSSIREALSDLPTTEQLRIEARQLAITWVKKHRLTT